MAKKIPKIKKIDALLVLEELASLKKEHLGFISAVEQTYDDVNSISELNALTFKGYRLYIILKYLEQFGIIKIIANKDVKDRKKRKRKGKNIQGLSARGSSKRR